MMIYVFYGISHSSENPDYIAGAVNTGSCYSSMKSFFSRVCCRRAQ
jgi:hypothetical protein